MSGHYDDDDLEQDLVPETQEAPLPDEIAELVASFHGETLKDAVVFSVTAFHRLIQRVLIPQTVTAVSQLATGFIEKAVAQSFQAKVRMSSALGHACRMRLCAILNFNI